MATLFDWAASQHGKREGMDRVEAHADPSWSAAMYEYAVQTARALPYFTSDDVFATAFLAGFSGTTRDYRAFGPVMLRVAKAGVCCKADRMPVPSKRLTLHSSPRPVWRSLIYTGA